MQLRLPLSLGNSVVSMQIKFKGEIMENLRCSRCKNSKYYIELNKDGFINMICCTKCKATIRTK